VKPDFKALGPRFGKQMKAVAAAVSAMAGEAIATLERTGSVTLDVDGQPAEIQVSDVEILADDIPGWTVSSESGVTVALDITVDEELRAEGMARELVNRVQNLRKDSGLEVTDRIRLRVDADGELRGQLELNLDYIRTETLADEIIWETGAEALEVELVEGTTVRLALTKND
jgi:isoleucyl-tRNA synthetase